MENAERQMQFVFRLRSGGVKDTRVLSAMEQIPREAFMEGIFKDRAYEDVALPIPCGQTISSPSVVGLMTQALDVTPRSKVLEIGTADDVPSPLIAQLADGGALVMPVGSPERSQTLIKVIKTPDGLEYKEFQDVRFVPLVEGIAADNNA